MDKKNIYRAKQEMFGAATQNLSVLPRSNCEPFLELAQIRMQSLIVYK